MLKTLSIICYIAALVCFSYTLTETIFITDSNPITGIWLLIGGPLGILFFHFSWYGNFLSLLALLIAYKSPKKAIIISLFAILLASQAFFLKEIPFQKIISIVNYQPAIYFWYFSHLLVLWGIIFHWLSIKQKEEKQALQKTKNIRIVNKLLILHFNETKHLNTVIIKTNQEI